MTKNRHIYPDFDKFTLKAASDTLYQKPLCNLFAPIKQISGEILLAHNLGNCIQNLVVAAAAACRAVSDLLNLFKLPFNIAENLGRVKSVLDIGICNAYAVADLNIFHIFHKKVPP